MQNSNKTNGKLGISKVPKHLSKTFIIISPNGCFLGQMDEKSSIWACIYKPELSAFRACGKASNPLGKLGISSSGHHLRNSCVFEAYSNAFGRKHVKIHWNVL